MKRVLLLAIHSLLCLGRTSGASDQPAAEVSISVWLGFDRKSATSQEFFSNVERIGFAVPVSGDGYMITAAHVMEDDACGLPFSRNEPMKMLNVSSIVRGKAFYIDSPRELRQFDAMQIGFRRLRLVKEFKSLDLALVHIKGTFGPHVTSSKPPENSAAVTWATHGERRFLSRSAPVRDRSLNKLGWTFRSRLGCVQGDSGSAVFCGEEFAGIVREGVKTEEGVMTVVSGLPFVEIKRAIAEDKLKRKPLKAAD